MDKHVTKIKIQYRRMLFSNFDQQCNRNSVTAIIKKFGEFFDNICIDDNGYLAIHSCLNDDTALVRVIGEC